MADSIRARIELPVRPVVLSRLGIEELVRVAPPPIEVMRPGDLVHLRFSFINLALRSARAGNPPMLVRANGRKPAFLVVETPSQHITEQALLENQGIKVKNPPPSPPPPTPPLDPDVGRASDALPGLPVFSSISGPSRLVFKVRTETIPYSVEGLLGILRELDLSVASQAAPPASPRVRWFGELWAAGTIDITGIIPTVMRVARARDMKAARDVASGAPLGARLTAVGNLRRTTQVLEYRFGTDAALRAFANTRLGAQTNARRLADELNVNVAFARLPPVPAPPGETETALELPWRLIVSPNEHAAFAHSPTEVEHNGRVELWHSRLGLRDVDDNGKPILDQYGHPQVDEEKSDYRTIRAIWARDYDVLATAFPRPPAVGPFPAANNTQDEPNVRLALNSRDRMMLVHETANFHLTRNRSDWTPPAVKANRLMLSSLGGWLDSRADIPDLPDGPLTITEWKHRAAMGRDHEVRVVYAGFLLPFGHKASLVKVTERKFREGPDGVAAYLFQRMYIVVREEQKEFRDSVHELPLPSGTGRLDYVMPLQTVRILTRVTPLLDPQQNLDPAGSTLFVPQVSSADFPFKIVTVDIEGNSAEFSGPLVFMERDRNVAGALEQALDCYNKLGDRRAFGLNGQRVAFAESKSPDDTTLATTSVTISAVAPAHLAGLPQDEPHFLPIVEEAKVVVPAMSALAGAATPTRVGFAAHYAENGFTANAAEVFLQALDVPQLGFAGQGDRSGGFVTPSLEVTALSRLTGPIGGNIDDAVAGTSFDITKFFDASGAKLFGLIPLGELLTAVGFSPDKVPAFVAQTLDVAAAFRANLDRLTAAAAQQVALGTAATNLQAGIATLLGSLANIDSDPVGAPDPSFAVLGGQIDAFITAVQGAALPLAQQQQLAAMTAQVKDQIQDAAATIDALRKVAQGLKVPDVITARLNWSTDIHGWPKKEDGTDQKDGIFQPTDEKGDAIGAGKLTLAVEIHAPTKPGHDPTTLVSCSISPFKLQLIATITTFLELRFKTMEFSITPGKKPDVNVVFQDNGIVFTGPLEFVNTLREIIPADGFSDPPYLDVSTDGIKAGFDLGIPDLAVGVFALQNINLGAHLKVPFIAESIEFGFNFCTRENPFRLSVSLFAGGGFFGITITPKEVRVLEASLEFGAAVSLNFGVASGGVSVMAGIYFRLESGAASLTGYFRARGEVDVLGLISACIELYLDLTYETATKKAIGHATLSIEVEVLFLSFSVEISCEKKFAGGNEDPSFVDLMGLPSGAPAGAVRPWDSYCHAFADD